MCNNLLPISHLFIIVHLYKHIIADPFLSAKAISEMISEKTSEKIDVTPWTIENDLAQRKKLGILTHEGGRRKGLHIVGKLRIFHFFLHVAY